MFVDDEEDQLFTYKQMLDIVEKDYDFIGLNSGEKCLQNLKNGIMPDILFLDIMMPVMSGWELYDRIRDNDEWNSIPIVFLTARKDLIALNAGSFLGEDYLEKPVDIQGLIQCIDKITNKKPISQS